MWNQSSISGKRVLVTAGADGIGLAIARSFVSAGARVLVCDVRESALARLASDLPEVHGCRADVSSEADVAALFEVVDQKLGGLDILVNNAGIARDQLLLRMKRDDWDQVIGTNLTAAFTFIQAAIKPMVRQRSGRIISISSVGGQMGNAGQANYAASKAGLIGLTKAIAREHASRQITVNAVSPGFVETDMTRAIAEKAQGDWASHIPLGRMGTPEDVAAAALYLASEEAGFVTGQVLRVNGGLYV